MLQVLGNVDRRIIYIAIAVAVAAPLVWPIGLPLDVNANTEAMFKLIENLKPGDKVLFPIDFLSASADTALPQGEALARHLMRRPGIKIVAMSFNDQGHLFADRILAAAQSKDKQYGIDYINLGFIAGGEGSLAGFLSNIRSVVKADYTGKPVDSFPIMQGINSVNDFQLVIGTIMSVQVGETAWIRQMGAQKVPFAFGTASASYTSWIPFVQSGQIKALLDGLRGAAEYEKLIDFPGRATKAMDAQSVGHLLIILLIVLGNIGYVVEKSNGKKQR